MGKVKTLLLCGFGTLALGLNSTANAASVSVTPIFDAEINLSDTTPTIDSTDWTMLSQKLDPPYTPKDSRGFMEFDFSILPDNAQIQSVSFRFQAGILTYDNQNDAEFSLYAYAGDGAISASDASQLSYLALWEQTVGGLGEHTVALDVDAINSAWTLSDYVGLVQIGTDVGHQVGIRTTESAKYFQYTPPTLTINFTVNSTPTVPTPAALPIGILGLAALATRRRKA
ncbi:hypothetical protein [Poriferisphaera sp. WC338]|uniref:hypothetical protein n=1 Tax=Poriferisphaera sp. WC338 TaxID=3425129 RepID=UPI003D81C2FD